MKIKRNNSRRAAETQRKFVSGGNPPGPLGEAAPKNLCALGLSAPLREKNIPVHITPEVMPPLGDIEEPKCNTPGERINYHVGMAQHHGRQALAHLILAGWELAKQKQAIGYGGWNEWCDKNLQISKATADRYVQFFHKTVGEARKAAEKPVAKKPTLKELAAATVGMEQKSATRAMIDLGVIKRIKNEDGNSWGGAGRGQGRKPKGEAATAEEEVVALDEIKDTPAVLWGLCRDPLHKLNDLQRERHFIDRLEFVELSEVYSILKGLFEAADKAMKRMQKEGRHA